MNQREISVSWNVHGVCVFAKAPDSKTQFLVMFKAHDVPNPRFRSRSWRIKNYRAARKAFDKLSDMTGDA